MALTTKPITWSKNLTYREPLSVSYLNLGGRKFKLNSRTPLLCPYLGLLRATYQIYAPGSLFRTDGEYFQRNQKPEFQSINAGWWTFLNRTTTSTSRCGEYVNSMERIACNEQRILIGLKVVAPVLRWVVQSSLT